MVSKEELEDILHDEEVEARWKSIRGSKKIKKAEVAKRQQMPVSLMPEGLHLAMSEKQLIDLVEFLAGLKTKKK